MTENPLDPSPAFEARVRQRAYHLWEQDGRPEGRAPEFWERAHELEAMAAHPDAGLLPNPARDGAEPRFGEPVEEAALMENLGEFPDRSSDQGEHLTSPMTRDEEHKWAEEERPTES